MIPYTSAIPKLECLDELLKYCDDWRMLLSPASYPSINKSNEHLMLKHGYAIDNGIYADWVKDRDWDEDKFFMILDRYAARADWIVIPDSIGDWDKTISLFMIWVNKLFHYHRPLMIVAQDGAEQNDYREIRGLTKNGHRMIDGGIGVFIGGTTEWKLNNAGKIAKICRDNNALCHIGRVNSAKRVRMCWNWGATSFDGSGMSRFSLTARYVSSELLMLRTQEKQQLKLF